MTSHVHGTSTGGVHRAQLPVLTVGVFLVLALVFWVNAVVNRYRFNVALAVLASVPLVVVLLRAAVKTRRAARTVHDSRS